MGDMMDDRMGPEGEGMGAADAGSAPPQEGQPAQPAAPRASGVAPAEPVPPAPQQVAPEQARQRPTTIWWLFFVGLATPIAASVLFGFLMQLLASTPATQSVLNGAVPLLLVPVSFAAFLILLLTARSAGRARLASFSKGALWAYALIPLGFLLLFGACLFPGQGA